MRFTGTLMPAFADNLSGLYQHTADPRIGISGEQTTLGQLQGPSHETMIVIRLMINHRRHSFSPSSRVI